MLKFIRWRKNPLSDIWKMKNYRTLLYCSLTAFIAVTFIGGAHTVSGQTRIRTIEVVGTSVIHKTDIETAKQQAISNGLVSAVDRIVCEVVPLTSLTQNFKIIDKTIYSDTENFVNDYKVLTEAVSGQNYRVLIQVKISMERLKNRLETSGVMRVQKRRIHIIDIMVQGTRNLSHFINFREGLKEISGVKSIQVSDMRPDEANILVKFEGGSKELTEALVLKKFDKFSIRIFEISEDKLRIELVPG